MTKEQKIIRAKVGLLELASDFDAHVCSPYRHRHRDGGSYSFSANSLRPACSFAWVYANDPIRPRGRRDDAV